MELDAILRWTTACIDQSISSNLSYITALERYKIYSIVLSPILMPHFRSPQAHNTVANREACSQAFFKGKDGRIEAISQ